MMIKRILFVFFAGLVLAGCKNSLYIEEEIKSPDDVISITVTPPNKMLYKYGEPFEKTGMKVTIHFRGPERDPMEEVVDDTAKIDVSGYNSYAEGIQTITASARGKSDTFKIALMVIPPNGEGVVVASGGTVTLRGVEGSSKGSWDAYVYDAAGRQVDIKPAPSDSGTGSISFSLPASVSVGDYTLVVAFRIDAKMYYEFYKLTVN
jgi:hypothetical protein